MVSPPSSGLFQRVIMQSNPAGFSYTTPGYMAVYGDVRMRCQPGGDMHLLTAFIRRRWLVRPAAVVHPRACHSWTVYATCRQPPSRCEPCQLRVCVLRAYTTHAITNPAER